jgi:hypothetical protein
VEIPTSTVTSYPPSRVTDLKIVAIQVNQTSMTIEWTATGQQLDEGIGISLVFVMFFITYFLLVLVMISLM